MNPDHQRIARLGSFHYDRAGLRVEKWIRADAHYKLHLDNEHYIAEADGQYLRPIVTRHYNSSWDLFDNHLYPGGAWWLHMLRKHVGDEAFWAATRDYLEQYREQVVETDDFRHAVETSSGLNLVRFFDGAQPWVGAYAPFS